VVAYEVESFKVNRQTATVASAHIRAVATTDILHARSGVAV
jgi:hypothetical protein